MRKLISLVISALVSLALAGCGQTNTKNASVPLPPSEKILIAYYSQMGHSASVAKEIQKQIGGDLFQIKTNIQYPKNVPGTLTQVKREYVEQIRPQLTTEVKDFSKYELVILGYPNWYDDPPMGVITFLEQHKWQGKIIAPYITYGLSGYGTSIATIKKAAPEATVVKGMALHASKTKASASDVEKWLTSLNWRR